MKFSKKNISLSPKGSPENIVRILSTDMILAELDESVISGKGMQSSTFLALNPNDGEPDYVVKFCKYYVGEITDQAIKGNARFDREIQALNKVESKIKSDVLKERIIKLYGHSTEVIDGKVFKYLVMEKADCDLKFFLSQESLSLQQKIIFCWTLLQAFGALHKIGIYHRDIKPENIFYKGGILKIGDLGLIADRDKDYDFDGIYEKIGPSTLLSPEAINKTFIDRDKGEFSFDCKIDNKSDIFQLGKLFWYIFQGNYPTGQVDVSDFKIEEKDIFNKILFPMLQYAKTRRPNISKLDSAFKPIRKRFAI